GGATRGAQVAARAGPPRPAAGRHPARRRVAAGMVQIPAVLTRPRKAGIPKTGVPAKAGTHRAGARALQEWVPAFAGTPNPVTSAPVLSRGPSNGHPRA